MREDLIEDRALLEQGSEAQTVRRRAGRVVAIEPERLGEPRECSGKVSLVH